MKVGIPPSYIVYLYGHMFASPSFFGHKHVVTGKRLNSIQLRKAIKMAMLVSLYGSGIVDFEVRTKKGWFRKRKELFIKLLKEVESSDFFFEKDILAPLKEKGEVVLNFYVPRIYGYGVDDKMWMDHMAKTMNKELAKEGYLKEEEVGRYASNEKAIEPLRSIALEIKSKISDFEARRTDLIKILYANL